MATTWRELARNPGVTPGRVGAALLRVPVVAVLLVVYWTISSEGLRTLLDYFAVKVHKTGLPFANLLGDFDETRKLDVANAAALLLLFVSLVFSERLVRLYASRPAGLTNRDRLTWLVGTAILAIDAAVFFAGVSSGGDFFSGMTLVPALLVTALYVFVLLGIALVFTTLSPE